MEKKESSFQFVHSTSQKAFSTEEQKLFEESLNKLVARLTDPNYDRKKEKKIDWEKILFRLLGPKKHIVK